MKKVSQRIADLLPRGAISDIAGRLGISRQAVSEALNKGKPGHPAVVEALRMARESGSFDAALSIADMQLKAST